MILQKFPPPKNILCRYQDLHIHARVLMAFLRLIIAGKHNWMTLVDVPLGSGCYMPETVVRYVEFWLYLARRLGKGTTCLPRSVLLCRVLRQSGIEARITFGATKPPGGVLTPLEKIRHCWVEEAGEGPSESWAPLLRYP